MKGKITITVPVEKDRHAELSAAAKKRGMSLASFMRDAAFEKMERLSVSNQ